MFWRGMGEGAEDFYILWRGGEGLEGTLDGAEVAHFIRSITFMIRGGHALGMSACCGGISGASKRKWLRHRFQKLLLSAAQDFDLRHRLSYSSNKKLYKSLIFGGSSSSKSTGSLRCHYYYLCSSEGGNAQSNSETSATLITVCSLELG